jgi:hypothetical protein
MNNHPFKDVTNILLNQILINFTLYNIHSFLTPRARCRFHCIRTALLLFDYLPYSWRLHLHLNFPRIHSSPATVDHLIDGRVQFGVAVQLEVILDIVTLQVRLHLLLSHLLAWTHTAMVRLEATVREIMLVQVGLAAIDHPTLVATVANVQVMVVDVIDQATRIGVNLVAM